MPVLSTLGAAIANVYGFTSGLIKDQYFNLVSLLLPGNGTNGAQNNTFLDGSSNTFTITRNGNTTQGTFSPFSQTGWGNYFDGSGDYLTTPIANVQLGSGDFCVEQWVYLIARPNTVNCIFSNYTSYSTGVLGLYYGHAGGNTAKYQVGYNGSSFPSLQSTTDIVYNTWVHLAVVRSSGTIKLYINGVAESSTITSATATLNGNGASWWVGTEGQSGTTGVINAYVSNHRVVVGSPVYTGNFTPSTAPLTAISGTSLLTCQSNRFRDSSSNNHAITVNGNPSVTPFSPFAPTSSYSAAAVGGSGYFDGSGDYLSAPSNAAFSFSTSSFTVEAWVYLTAATNNSTIASNASYSGADGDWIVRVGGAGGAAGKWEFVTFFGGTAYQAIANSAVTTNAWTHIAAVKSGNTMTIYVNGTAQTTTASNANSVGFSNQSTLIASSNGFGNFPGYISNLRIVKGTAVVPPSGGPTSPVAEVSGTSLLLNFTNAGVVDATAKNVLETVGNAQIVNPSPSKWGNGSIRFDGTSNTSCMIAQGRWQPFFGANFSIEMWFRVDALSGVQTLISQDWRRGIDGPKFSLFIGEASSDRLTYLANGGAISIIAGAGNAIIANTWYFVQVIKSGSTTTMYLNGTSIGSAADTYTYPVSTYATYIGRSDPGGSIQGYLTGYIDDLRITIGQARTAGTSTAPFPLQ